MAYNIKDVFYLSTSATIDSGTANGGGAQLDLSAYIDPIARGRSKGIGLAVYKVHFSMAQSANANPIDDAEVGTCRFGLVAGYSSGDKATGGLTGTSATFSMENDNLISSGDFYGPKSFVANASNPAFGMLTESKYLSPDTEVPYVIVRDSVGLIYEVGDNFTSESILSVRLSCAQITLDQSTLNQLLRTQTV